MENWCLAPVFNRFSTGIGGFAGDDGAQAGVEAEAAIAALFTNAEAYGGKFGADFGRIVEPEAVDLFAAAVAAGGIFAETDDPAGKPAAAGAAIDFDMDGPVSAFLPIVAGHLGGDAIGAGDIEDKQAAWAEGVMDAAEEAGERGAGVFGIELVVDDFADGGDGVADGQFGG